MSYLSPFVTRLLRCMLFFLLPISMFAESTIGIPVNPRFVVVNNLDELADNTPILLMAFDNGQGKLLTNTFVSGKKKFKTLPVTSIADTIAQPALSCIWQLVDDGTGRKYLVSYTGHQAVEKDSKSATDVGLNADINAARVIHFNLSQQGSFVLFHFEDRLLSYSEGRGYVGLFYPDNEGYSNFVVYRYVCDSLAVSDNGETCPQPFVFIHDNQAVNASDAGSLSLTDVTPYKLSDSSYASDVPAMKLRLSGRAVINSENDTIWSTNNGRWIYSNNCLFVYDDNDAFTLALSRGKENAIQWVNTKDIDGLTRIVIPIAQVALPATQTFDGGCLTLTGGWSHPRLEKLQFDETVLALDMTKSLLPESIPNIDVSKSNILIFMSDIDTAKIDIKQQNVVSVSQDRHTLVRSMYLVDRKPFSIQQPIEIGEGVSVNYSRMMPDGGWQTLILPFKPDAVPHGIEVAKVTSVSENGVTIEDTTVIEKNVPILFKYNGRTPVEVTWTGSNQTMSPTVPIVSDKLTGVFEKEDIETNDGIYCLNSAGDAFVKAVSGSYIDPFRAYLRLDNVQSQKIMLNLTGISSVKKDMNSQNKIFTLDGKTIPIDNGSTMSKTRKLPRGIYIINKRIVKL